jgi:trehalose-6-phosphatase
LLLPAGFEFDPPVISTLIINRLDPSKEALLLFDIDGTWEEIPKESFVVSTRSAIRFTKGRCHE